jgi:Ca-activated chloride channel family protein
MFRNSFFFFFFFFFALQSLQAQNVAQLLNSILSNYGTQNRTQLEAILPFLEQSNLYLVKAVETNTPPASKPIFRAPNKASIELSYQQLFEASTMLNSKAKGEFNLNIGKVKRASDEIYEHTEALYQYIQKNKIDSKNLPTQAIKLLKRIHILYFDVKILNIKIRWELQEIHNAEQNSKTAAIATIPKTTIAITNLYESVGNALKSMYDQRDKESQIAILELQKLTDAFEAIIPSLQTECSKEQTQALYSLTAACKKLKLMLQQNLTKQNLVQKDDYAFGQLQLNHNLAIMPILNTKGTGIIPLANKLLIELKAPFSVTPEETPIFKPLIPKPMLTPEEAPINVDEFFKNLEAKNKENNNTTAAPTTPPTPPTMAATPTPPTPPSTKPTLEGFASNNLIFLFDASASMVDPEKLPLLQNSISYLLNLMRPQDHIGAVSFAKKSRILIEPTSATNKSQILETINNIKPSGSSSFDEGIETALNLAEKHLIHNGNNRILIATDGAFEISRSTKKIIKDYAKKQINISIIYLSKREKKEVKAMLEELAQSCNGSYHYMNTQNAEKILLSEAQQVKK